MNNNYRCDIKKYPESNIVRRNWGQWEVDADKCSNYDALSTELKINEQIADETRWGDIRERAAIAAMQGMLGNPNIRLANGDTYPKVAVMYADALIEELKKKKPIN